MATATEVKVYLKRVFQASRERVFAAWTNPQDMDQWCAPGPLSPKTEVDLRVGGKYRIVMYNSEDHSTMIAGGEYREIRKPERLVYTWSWEGGEERMESLVTVEFREKGDATEVVLTHEKLPSEESKVQHTEGWNGCLVKLEQLLQ